MCSYNIVFLYLEPTTNVNLNQHNKESQWNTSVNNTGPVLVAIGGEQVETTSLHVDPHGVFHMVLSLHGYGTKI